MGFMSEISEAIGYKEGYQKALEDYKKNIWHKVENGLPDKEGNYLCYYKSFSRYPSITICGFTLDAFNVSKYDFEEYKDKKKALFYNYDSEYGYYEINQITHWAKLPDFPEE